jgi:hypothetical protein
VQTQGTFKHINEVYQTMWFVNFHYQNILEAFAHFTPNYGSSITINNVKIEETIFINDNGVSISNSQIEGNIINAKGAPYKKAKTFYETSQKFQESWAVNFHQQNGPRDDELLQFVKCCIHLDVIRKEKFSTPKEYAKE